MKLYALADCNLSAEESENAEIDALIEPYLNKLYSGEWDKNRVADEIYLHNVKALLDGYKEGYEKTFFSPDWTVRDNNLLTRVQNNIFAFSGAKSYAEMQELRDAVYENGVLLSPGDYKRKARKINSRYNVRYLEVERQNVIVSGTQGSRWLDIEESADTHPYLEYVTANDEHVREEHRRLHGLIYPVDDPFWRQFYPPNGWGPCRCSTRKLTERLYEHQKANYQGKNKSPMPTSEEAQKIAGKVVAKPFRHNVGTAEIFERDGHPYFKANAQAKEMQLSAVKNYGMKPAKEIYADSRNLSKYKKEIGNEKDYREYWDILESHYGKPGEGFTLTDKRQNISAWFDNTLKEKMLERGRYTYFDEAIDVFNNPDEIWGTFQMSKNRRFGEQFFNAYVKYYEDKPLVLLVDKDGAVKSFYKWDREIEDFEKFRVGLLKQKR